MRKAAVQEADVYPKVVSPLTYAVIDTCDSVLFLARKDKLRDCFVLSRVAFETIVNICYICAEGEQAAERAAKHARQKMYRGLNRQLEIGKRILRLEWQGEINLDIDYELRLALEEFTSRKGREITSWTQETLIDRIRRVDERYGEQVGMPLQFALLALYRDASEIAHGTLFGSLLALGFANPPGPPKSKGEFLDHHRGNLSMVLMMLCASIQALILVLAEEWPALRDFVSESEKAYSEVKIGL